MADTGTCGECEHWKLNFRVQQGNVGMCSRNMAYASTWEDCTCPAFKRWPDAAERAARRMRDDIGKPKWHNVTPEEWYLHCEDVIREEIAKDKEAR